jgi:hypothetical protein
MMLDEKGESKIGISKERVVARYVESMWIGKLWVVPEVSG